MNQPSKQSIKFAQESAARIDNIKIEAEPKFYFDIDSKGSNSIDEEFLVSLEDKKHLTDEYRSQYAANIAG